MSKHDWTRLLEDYFQVPGEPVYILGCFAGHVTVYSQQVRALNMVAALKATGRLGPGTKVAIVGGGAAGLMAAASSAYLKAEVTLLDQLPGPMWLQRSNRQRYLHPYIYDWPDGPHFQPDARLPFFPWTADYAEKVAERMDQQWKEMIRDPNFSLTAHWEVSDVSVRGGSAPRVSWNHRNPRDKGDGHFNSDLVVLAVGFGLEGRDRPWQGSYWSGDDLDDELYHVSPKRRFLVSGAGDGGLVDVMRLCIRGFRHDKVLTSIRDLDGIKPLGDDLLKIHKEGSNEQQISDKFADHVQPEAKKPRMSACLVPFWKRSAGRSEPTGTYI